MKFIEFETIGQRKIYINPDEIASVEDCGSHVCIYMKNGARHSIDESFISTTRKIKPDLTGN